MTSDLMPLLVVLLVVCCIALIWFYMDAQEEKTQPTAIKTDNREQVIDMLSRVSDHFTLSVYQKVYDIKTREIESKRRAHRKPH